MNTYACNVEDINIPISQNVLCCLLLHLLRIVPTSFALDHSPCARMIWISTKGLILWRCKGPYHRHQQQICPCAVWTNWLVVHLQVSPFLLPWIHRISALGGPSFINIPFWVACVRTQQVGALLLSKQRASPFYRTSQRANSEDFDFRVWFFLGFLMQ